MAYLSMPGGLREDKRFRGYNDTQDSGGGRIIRVIIHKYA
jgi:hypothetical protein